MEATIKNAIETSIAEDRSVAITLPSVDDIYTIDGYEDCAKLPADYSTDSLDEVYDVWGANDDGSGWRLTVTVPETIYVDETMVTDGEDLSDFSIETFAEELTERLGRKVEGIGGNGALGKNRRVDLDAIIPQDTWDAAFAAAVTAAD